MGPNEVKQAFSCTPFRTEKTISPEYEMITHNLYGIKLAQDKMSDVLYELKNNQDLAALNHECQKKINTLIDTDGTMDFQKFNSMMQELKSNLDLKMIWEKQELEKHSIENPRAQKFLNQLSLKYQPFFDLIESTTTTGTEIIKDAKTFTKEQVHRLVSNIEMDLEEINGNHTTIAQQLTRLTHETHERHQSAKTMLQTLHSLYMTLARAIRGG